MPKRVLVADDSSITRKLLNKALTAAGYEVETAEDGFIALEKLIRFKYDLLISDMNMPSMNGMELITRIRDEIDMQNLPIIVLTSVEGEEQSKLAIEAGANLYVQKPVKDEIFVKKIQNLLKMVHQNE
ncbi:MAG: response regulator [Leptospiraceae bacterium]|nr:response regulator [Leptospiraceae bacterium]MCP5492993.1 response regulator [Leptospiraceae bacterium]